MVQRVTTCSHEKYSVGNLSQLFLCARKFSVFFWFSQQFPLHCREIQPPTRLSWSSRSQMARSSHSSSTSEMYVLCNKSHAVTVVHTFTFFARTALCFDLCSQEVQIFRSVVLAEEELGQTAPQTMCFLTRFVRNEFITSDAMSKLRQVRKHF